MGMSKPALPVGAGDARDPLTEVIERNLDKIRDGLAETHGQDRQALADWVDTLTFCRDRLYSRRLGEMDVRDLLREFHRLAGHGAWAREQQGELEALAGRMHAEIGLMAETASPWDKDGLNQPTRPRSRLKEPEDNVKQYVIEMDEKHEMEILEELSVGSRASFQELDEFIQETNRGLGPQDLLREINAHLSGDFVGPQLQPAEPMNLGVKKQLVSLANTHFHWVGNEIERAWFEDDEDVWRSILGNYQELVGE